MYPKHADKPEYKLGKDVSVSDLQKIKKAREKTNLEYRYALVFYDFPCLFRTEVKYIDQIQQDDVFILVVQQQDKPDKLLSKKLMRSVEEPHLTKMFGYVVPCQFELDLSHIDMDIVDQGHDILYRLWQDDTKKFIQQLMYMNWEEGADFSEYLRKLKFRSNIDRYDSLVQLLYRVIQ